MKERNGKLILTRVILVLIILLGIGCFLNLYMTNQFVSSVIEEATGKVEKIRGNEIEEDIPILKFPEFMKTNRRILFVGSYRKGETQFINGLEFIPKDSMIIKYRLDFLENWGNKKTLEGEAELDEESIQESKYKLIDDRSGEIYPAYRFLGKCREYELEILISKEKNMTSSISKIWKIQENDTTDFTTIMYYK